MYFPDEEAQYKFWKFGKFQFIYYLLVKFYVSVQYIPKDFNIYVNPYILLAHLGKENISESSFWQWTWMNKIVREYFFSELIVWMNKIVQLMNKKRLYQDFKSAILINHWPPCWKDFRCASCFCSSDSQHLFLTSNLVLDPLQHFISDNFRHLA